jgi:MoxR-like ATPase
VLATQNPIEQEGTYPLPEAQADRFMLKIRVGYPTKEEEREIPAPVRDADAAVEPVASAEDLCAARRDAAHPMEQVVSDYVVELVHATRFSDELGLDLGRYIEFGASPRATLSLAQAARAYAFLEGRGYVTPDDVKAMGPDVLRHRVLLTYEAEAEGLTAEAVIEKVFAKVKTP